MPCYMYLYHKRYVEKFHAKNGFMINGDLEKDNESGSEELERELLNEAASEMLKVSIKMQRLMEKEFYSTRIERAQIMIEELAEIVEALITRDEVALLDGLADLQFVLLGTAITYDMPIEDAHLEVCRSNLSKKKRETRGKLTDKGPDYEPPKLKELLEEYRTKK